MIVYISIGNSDDKLSQQEWCQFIDFVDSIADGMRDGADGETHGRWFSAPDVPWQSACWCIQIYGDAYYAEGTAKRFRQHLASAAKRFRQDSIAWAEVPKPEFIAASEVPDAAL